MMRCEERFWTAIEIQIPLNPLSPSTDTPCCVEASMHLRHAEIKVEDWESPKGRYGNAGREHKPPEGSQCPFELEHYTLGPGKRNFPFHAHGSM